MFEMIFRSTKKKETSQKTSSLDGTAIGVQNEVYSFDTNDVGWIDLTDR